jgi:hypothetical protein
MSDVFMSYAREDNEVAKQLRQTLEDQGWSVHFDRYIAAGQDFSEVITEAVSRARVVLVLLSRHSKRSRWLENELAIALEKGQTVIPILLDSEAKDNWIWPLISDRMAIQVKSDAELNEVKELLVNVLGHEAMAKKVSENYRKKETEYPKAEEVEYPVMASKASSRWMLAIIAVISAVVGALFSLFFLK